jgi:hypothetical protein
MLWKGYSALRFSIVEIGELANVEEDLAEI